MLLIKILNRIRKYLNPIKFYRSIGVQIGKDCRLIGEVNFGSEPYLISIGNHVSITTSTFITHDGGEWIFREKNPEIDIVSPIKIGNNVFIGSDCIILPGVIIGDNVIVGARSVITKNIPSNSVYAGVPAKLIKSTDDYWHNIQNKIVKTKGLSESQKKAFLIAKYL